MIVKNNRNSAGMKLASKGMHGCLHRRLAFALKDVILEVKEHLSTAREGNKPPKFFSYITHVRESPEHPWVDFAPNTDVDYFRAAKIELVEKKLVELLDFVLDWEKDTLDD